LGHADSAGERASDESRHDTPQTAGAQPREREHPELHAAGLAEGEWTPAPSVQRALRAGVLPMRTTDPRHISLPPTAQPQSTAPTPQPTPMRTDGSTIDPEYELAQLAENELRYAMLARIANSQIRGLQTAIREGRGQ
jgi:hypothetical protein